MHIEVNKSSYGTLLQLADALRGVVNLAILKSRA